MLSWFNNDWLPVWEKNAPGRSTLYVMDGTYIEVPEESHSKYQNCGCVKDPDTGKYIYGYKAVFLYEIFDRGFIDSKWINEVNNLAHKCTRL